MLTLFSQIMSNVAIPMPVYRKGHGIEFRPFLLFRLFPVTLFSHLFFFAFENCIVYVFRI